MNRFRSKKAAPADAASGRDARRWKKGKQVQQDEAPPKVELAYALPSNDNFRTSLIMPNLSARFSMLRDQDDPASIMGKASDDSVLSPKRKSRLVDFGFSGSSGLAFIAEVQSTADSPSGPVSPTSIASTNTNSMARPRPVPANTLFGGRDKVFKMPKKGSNKNIGRFAQDQDVSKSGLQDQKGVGKTDGEVEDGELSDTASLPFGLATASTANSYAEDAIRWTPDSQPRRQISSSSTASDGGQDTISTTATSLASQPLASPRRTPKQLTTNATPPERSVAQRRLYAQGLVQDMHDQQASAITRLNSIHRQQATKPPQEGGSPVSRWAQSNEPTVDSSSGAGMSPPEPRARSNSSPVRPEGFSRIALAQSSAARLQTHGADSLREANTDLSASDEEDDIISEYAARDYPAQTPSRFRPTELENILEDSASHSRLNEVQTRSTAGSKETLVDTANATKKSQLRLHVESQNAVQRSESPKALGGLIHQHLRNTSNVSSSVMSDSVRESHGNHLRNQSGHSSVYTTAMGREDSVPIFEDPPKNGLRPHGVVNRLNNDYTHSNPWDLDDFEAPYQGKLMGTTMAPNEPLADAKSANAHNAKANAASNWQADHKRELSAGTVEERVAFDMELAARQKAIQENLKAIVEDDTRGNSPQPSLNGPFKAFNMLKSKASGDMSVKQDSQGLKTVKPSGLGVDNLSTSPLSFRKGSNTSDDTKFTDQGSAGPPPPVSKHTPPLGHQTKNGVYDMQRPRAETSPIGGSPVTRQSPVIGSDAATRSPDTRSRSASTSPHISRPQDGRGNPAGVSPSGAALRDGYTRSGASPRLPQGFAPPALKTSPRTPQQSSPQTRNVRQQNGQSAANSPADGRSAALSPSSGGFSLMPGISPPSHAQASRQGPGTPARSPIPQSPAPGLGPMARSPNPQSPAMSGGAFSPIPPQHRLPPTDPAFIQSQRGVLRKKTVNKSDISEPVLLSSTSNVDTVDLPPGASLRNGMDVPDNTPASNRRRKIFPFGKETRDEPGEQVHLPALVSRYPNPGAPPAVPFGAHSPNPQYPRSRPEKVAQQVQGEMF